jgi:hypothetical protein
MVAPTFDITKVKKVANTAIAVKIIHGAISPTTATVSCAIHKAVFLIKMSDISS